MVSPSPLPGRAGSTRAHSDLAVDRRSCAAAVHGELYPLSTATLCRCEPVPKILPGMCALFR
jgi:hypothetical protein